MSKKGKWSKEEDDLLINHFERHGSTSCSSWQVLSDSLGLRRPGYSCRDRWQNYLRPGLKHGNFTIDEERIICEMYNKKKKWSTIAAQLPGRTNQAVKNYWRSILKKKYMILSEDTKLPGDANYLLLGDYTKPPGVATLRRRTCLSGSTSTSSDSVGIPAQGLEPTTSGGDTAIAATATATMG